MLFKARVRRRWFASLNVVMLGGFVLGSLVLDGCDRAVPDRNPDRNSVADGSTSQGLTAESGFKQPHGGGLSLGSKESLHGQANDPAGLTLVPMENNKDYTGPGQTSTGVLPPKASTAAQPDQRALSATGIADGQASNATQERFLTIPPVKSDDPQRMQTYLQELDRLIENVRLTSIRMEPKKVSDSMAHLAKLKLDAGQHLASLTTASAQQVKAGRLAQLVALSHLSGLKDVQAARQLEDLASQLTQGSDPELAHQGRVVKFGFLIQNLQNGLIKDGQGVVKAAIELIDNDNYRGRPESASLTHAVATLEQLGFTGEAGELTRLAFQAFSSSSDPALRNQWWNELTKSSPATELFLRSVSDLGTDQQQAASVISAARGLVESYPNVITLENLAGFLSQIEYSGQMALSQQLAELIDNQRRTFLSSNSTVSGSPVYPGSPASVIDGYLGEHRLRAGWIGKSFTIQDLVDIDGKPLDPGSLSGKVVVVFFWTTGSLPCLRELPNLERTFNLLSSKGLAIVSINMDPDAAAFERFVVSNKLPWRSYRHQAGDNQLLTKQFGITMFPHTLLVDRSGKVVDLHVRGQKIVDRAQALLP